MIKKPIIRKPSDKKDDWSLLWKGLGVFVLLLIVAFVVNVYFIEERKRERYTCARMESDAQNTFAAISSYFADPDRITLPTIDQLIEEEGLFTTFPVKIEGDPEQDIIVSVINNGDAECPKGKKYVAVMGGGEGVWED